MAQARLSRQAAARTSGSVWDHEIADRRDRLAATLAGQLRAALRLAQETGELRMVVEPSDAPALLVGPLLHRGLLEPGPVSDALIERLVDAVGTWAGA